MKSFKFVALRRFAVFLSILMIVMGLYSFAMAEEPSSTSSLVVKLVAGLSPEEQAAVIASNGGIETSSIPALRLHVVEVPTSDLSTIISNYQADPRVISVEENKTRKAEAIPSDLYYTTEQWALAKIGWDMVFGTVIPTGSATVAVLDTGVDSSHPELAGKLVTCTSIIDGSDCTSDPHGHGTWMAGIIAANTDNNNGIAGVGYDGVKIMPITVLSADGTGQDSDIIAGVIWAVENGADVILMGFSNPGFSQNLQDAIDYAWSKNVVLVAATGNDGLNTPTFPAGDRGVIGVSATDSSDSLVSFSNYGQDVFLAAPGIDIATTDIVNSYVSVSGTSSSAAIVSGVAAFMRAVEPDLSNGVIVGRLARNADPAGDPINDPDIQLKFGNGRINMARALADTSLEEIQPAGAAPVGDGGPYVGPYKIAAVTWNFYASDCSTPKTAPITYTLGETVCVKATGLGGNHKLKWYDPSNVLQDTSAEASGTITDSYTPGSSGTWTIKAIKSSDNSESGSATFTVTAVAVNTTTTLTSSLNPSIYADNVTFTATVRKASDSSLVTEGSVTFIEGGTCASPTTTHAGPTALNGSGQASFSKSNLTTGSHTIIACYGGTSNYNSSNGNVVQTINPKALDITANNLTKTYGDTVTFAGTEFTTGAGQLVGSDSVTSVTLTSTGAAASATVAGSPYAIVPSAAVGTGLSNYTITYHNGQLTVNPKTLDITANNLTKTYGDTVTFAGTEFTTGAGQLVGSDSVTSVTLTSTGAAASATVAGSPYAIVPSAAVGTGLSNYTITYKNGILTVTPREALSSYIGQTVFVTSGSSSTTAQVTLSASVQDTDGAGSVANATVTFKDLLTGKILASGVKVSLVSNTDTKIGTANTVVTLSSGQYGAQAYLIEVSLGGSYKNTQQTGAVPGTAPYEAAHPTVTVMIPATKNTMQGSATPAKLPTAAGVYGDGTVERYDVGFAYNSKGTNPQGKIELIINRLDGVYYIKSNSITSVAFSNPDPVTKVNKDVTIYTKASIYKISGGVMTSIDGNVTLRLDAHDGGTTGGDTVGFTVLSTKNSSLYYSNNWVWDAATLSWKTVQQPVSDGIAVQIN